jgi:CheY-like chemotaxis protein
MSDRPIETAAIELVLSGVIVLLVEDNDDARTLLAAFLTMAGATPIVAASVDDALAAFDRQTPDVLASDLNMPVRDGWDLIREVRARPAEAGGRVPAIAVTADDRPMIREQLFDAGYDEFIAKPADPSSLIDAIARLAGRRGPSADSAPPE